MKYRAVVITVSDGCYNGERQDLSGPELVKALQDAGLGIHSTETVPDDRSTIAAVLQKYAAVPDVHLIVSTGGTGCGPRDVTPEATRDVIERPVPGISELLRAAGSSQTEMSWLSRGEAGIVQTKLIVNLPGSVKSIRHSVEVIKPLLFHALELLNGGRPH